MFRKPKKKPAFRKPGGGGGNRGGVGGGSKFRKRANSSSDEEGATTNGASASGGGHAEESTTDLLEQIRKEKLQKKGGNKRRRVGGGASDDEDGAANKKGVIQEFNATNDELTEKEMATRTAEHHPTAITQGLEKTEDTAAASSAAVAAAADVGDGDDEKIYKGQNTGTRNKFLAGPLKAPSFVRTTCRFDYQPDICKDYKDTGFCGFGDTCIYLHDRGDTMSGWQLEAQYEERKKAEREAKEKEMDRFLAKASGEVGSDDEEDEKLLAANDGLPFACHICRNAFTDPVVTNCGHYFCQKCIMETVRNQNAACPVCGKDTGGVFNEPTKLISKKRRLVGRNGTWEEFASASKK